MAEASLEQLIFEKAIGRMLSERSGMLLALHETCSQQKNLIEELTKRNSDLELALKLAEAK